jgi:hypothetical protein
MSSKASNLRHLVSLYDDAFGRYHAIGHHDGIKQKCNPTKYLLHLLSAVA